MTKNEPRGALHVLEAGRSSRSATPIDTPPSVSSAPSPPSRQNSPYHRSVASKSRQSPPLRTPLGSPRRLHFDTDDEEDMAGTRPPFHRPTDGRSQTPLLTSERSRTSSDGEGLVRPSFVSRTSTFKSSVDDDSTSVKKKYTYAAFFLVLSLISFVIQTETAVYIQHELGWNKAYAMLYFTHGSWSLLWPTQLLILRIMNWKTPWSTFWRRHVHVLRSTAQIVRSGNLHLTGRDSSQSPVPYVLKTIAFVTTALTVAGGSWYVAVDMTSASDLTAIYNCSAFFAYAFSIPLLNDKLRFDKVFSVAVAIAGVLTVAYGDAGPTKHGGQHGGVVGGDPSSDDDPEGPRRLWGNIIIGIGSVLYGLYEVLYKKLACPPDGASPTRGMMFAMMIGSLIGMFTLTVLWIPLPILHVMGWEKFQMPHGEAAWMMFISVIANATFSGSFLVLISLTSPVLSSVAALLTIFLVAIVDWLRTGKPLSAAAIVGGGLIIAAFLLLSWSTYREMSQERRKRLQDELEDTSDDE